MAVVQISKIQVRRGQKNSPSGVPQLSSAEFAWAVDTQELFIGNGSVAEGAPYVGNTKIITEHDNLLELAASYQFAPDYLTGSIPRSLQGKLDETVSVFDFGAINDGVTDNVAAFELAFTQLFRGSDSKYKKVLLVPNGTYVFSTDLRIPSNAIIQGETQAGVVLDIGDNNIQFITKDGDALGSFNGSNRPSNVEISNLTIQRTTGQVVLSGVADSTFKDIVFQGTYRLVDTISSVDAELSALFWDNLDYATRTTNITFSSCKFLSNSVSVKANQTPSGSPSAPKFATEVVFENCHFMVNYYGAYITSSAGQEHKWQFIESKFEEIYYHAFKSSNGKNTTFNGSTFKSCGNGDSLSQTPAYPIVFFGEKTGNILINCSSDRQQLAATKNVGTLTAPLTSSTVAITEVYNGDKVSFIDRVTTELGYQANYTPFGVLSAYNKSYTLRYFLNLGIHSRTGKLTISVSDDRTNVAITDEYQYSPSLTTDPGGSTMINFEFLAELANNDAVTGNETVVLLYKNPTNGTSGSLSFDVAYGV